jgi:LuxR family transcriptional regulator, maltose regulon positive regulatory protein
MAEPSAAAPTGPAAAGQNVLLATKLHVPRPRPGFVPRPRLAGRLEEGLARGLVLVCAPAGSGKTVLLADWARRGGRPVAWLSLDAADNDPARFWRHAVAAVGQACPGIGELPGPLLGPLAPSSSDGLVTALINELAAAQAAEDEVVLVLDDYHLIDSEPVHGSLLFLAEHLPPGLRLVLASRSDLPLPLARLRARGQLAELRAAELRFTTEEAAALLREAAGAELPGAAVAALAARTEGWAAGLQLVALSLRGQADTAGFVAAFSGSHRYVLDCLTGEVLERQDEHVRGFFLETSVLERLSGSCAIRSPGGPRASRCWRRSSGLACSWCRWMRCAAGGATTTCSPTCSAPGCKRSGPAGSWRCTLPRPPGTKNMAGRRCPAARGSRRGDCLGGPAD